MVELTKIRLLFCTWLNKPVHELNHNSFKNVDSRYIICNKKFCKKCHGLTGVTNIDGTRVKCYVDYDWKKRYQMYVVLNLEILT